jgi:hypothetical protein
MPSMTTSQKNLAQGVRLLTVGVTALLIAAALVGCQTEDPSGSEGDCLLSGVYGVNPTTGMCEIVSGCVVSSPSGLSYPDGWTACDDSPRGHCEGLNEPTCGTVPGCEPHYTRTSGPVTLETDDATVPSDSGDAAMPYPGPMPPVPGSDGYLYAGCYAHVDLCAGLDEQTCSYTSGCAPQYASVPCECDARVEPPVDGSSGAMPMPTEDCACIALAQYEGCAEADIPQPTDCYSAGDTNTCLSQPGCRWVGDVSGGSSGSGAAEDICFCDDPADANCGCGGAPMPPERVGYCEPDYPMDPCMGWGDVRSCVGTPGCEWIEGAGAPVACDCAPGTDCVCTDFAPQPEGYCQQTTQPDSCYSAYDEYSCISARGCEWVGMTGGEAPPVDGDCICAEGDPNCGCGGMPAPMGYCQPYSPPTGCWSYYDMYGCGSDAACVWINADGSTGGGADIAPCECVPGDTSCACARPAPMPEGYCADRVVEPIGCAQYGDERSCASDPTCGWKPADGGFAPPCTCPADDPTCGCDTMPEPWGECYDLPQDMCGVYGDEFSCVSDPTCAWSADGGAPAPDLCDPAIPGCGGVVFNPCAGAWQDENGMCRGPADEVLADECCTTGEQPPFGHCYAAQQDPCAGLPDAFSCQSKTGCVWTEDNGNRPIMPPCTDPADPNCVVVSQCDGAQLDAAGQCILPTGDVAPQDCCGVVVGGGACSSGR